MYTNTFNQIAKRISNGGLLVCMMLVFFSCRKENYIDYTPKFNTLPPIINAVTDLNNRGLAHNDYPFMVNPNAEGRQAQGIVIPYTYENKVVGSTIRFMDDRNPKFINDQQPGYVFGTDLQKDEWEVVLVFEGIFDAIAIKRNAIPLFGKNIQSNLMKKLVESKVQKIYIALDNDAVKQALKFCEQLLDVGKEVYLVELQGKDPSEMGFEHFTKLIQNTTPLTQYKLMEKKLSII